MIPAARPSQEDHVPTESDRKVPPDRPMMAMNQGSTSRRKIGRPISGRSRITQPAERSMTASVTIGRPTNSRINGPLSNTPARERDPERDRVDADGLAFPLADGGLR